jgi:hypothetical protein
MFAADPASAQRLWIGGAVQRDVQRFTEDVVPNRLNGSAIGWSLNAETLVRRRVALAAEWFEAGVIEDLQTTTLDVNGRTVAISSTFRHRTRALAALGGFGHELTTRVRLAYLVGVAFTHVRREFTSDAAGMVLVAPSDPTAAGPAVVDRFPALTGGVDALVRLAKGAHLAAGVRAQHMALDPDLTGWSVRTFIGAGWMF